METLNNFYLAIFSTEVGVSNMIGFATYFLLLVILLLCIFDVNSDTVFWFGLLQLLFNSAYCTAYLPEHYFVLTKITIFFIPYILISVVVIYTNFIKDRLRTGK